MGKVFEIPDLLERRAQKIEAALDRQEDANERTSKADKDWKEATFELAVELAAAKKELRTTNAFGKWRDERFGGNRLPHQECAILVRWGADPEGTRTMLVNETSRSIRVIDERLTRTGKSDSTDSRRGKPPIKTDAAINIGRAMVNQTGELPTRNEIAKAAGVHNSIADTALKVVKAEYAAKIAPPQPQFTKAQEYHIEAQVKIRFRELEKEFEAHVTARNQEDIAKLFPKLQEIQDQAALNEKLYRELIAKHAIFTEVECMDIIKACHPDNSATPEVRQRAFIAINAKKFQLTGRK